MALSDALGRTWFRSRHAGGSGETDHIEMLGILREQMTETVRAIEATRRDAAIHEVDDVVNAW